MILITPKHKKSFPELSTDLLEMFPKIDGNSMSFPSFRDISSQVLFSKNIYLPDNFKPFQTTTTNVEGFSTNKTT